MKVERIELAGLTTYVTGPADAAATCVLLHGFGAGGDDLVPMAAELGTAGVRFVFPAAPLELAGGYGESRAWWMLDLARLEAELARGQPRDRRDEVPEGLAAARATMLRLLDQLEARLPTAGRPLVLGGFSQGSMLALDVALHRARPPAGLALMSSTLINAAAWQPRLATLAGVPVVLSHGRADALLPYAVAETLRDLLRGAGATVEWVPFVGGHELPRAVMAAVGAMLARLAAA
jgi:phospholipase/carboxylesterase